MPEEDSANALVLRDAYLDGKHDLVVPDVFPIEIGHALARAERRGIIQPPVGAEHLADLLAIMPRMAASIGLLPRAFEIASAVRVGVYDCVYIALAERENCPFITADQKLIAALRDDFPFIVALQ